MAPLRLAWRMAALTEARLDEIERRATYEGSRCHCAGDVLELVAEVRALRAERSSLLRVRDAAEAVATVVVARPPDLFEEVFGPAPTTPVVVGPPGPMREIG